MRIGYLVLAIAIIFVCATPSEARPPYAEQMYKTYEAFGKKHGNVDKKAVSCAVCHVKSGSRTNFKKRNNYGFAVSKGLEGKNDKKNIEAAIKKAADMPSKTKGKTFGELIKNLDLPGTNEEAS